MAKFRKKSVVIEAVRWMGKSNCGEMVLFLQGIDALFHNPLDTDGFISIPTLEGTVAAQMGDWVIKGIKGEYYPCKPDIFEATYEEVKDGI